MSSSGRYGTGHMTQNPSYRGVSGYSEMGQSSRSSGISSDLLGGSTGYSYYNEGTEQQLQPDW